MEFKKIVNLLNNTLDQISKFCTNNRVEINDDSRGTHNTNSQLEFKTLMLKSSLCDYSDAYIPVKSNITVANTTVAPAAANNVNKKVIFKNGATFTNCLSKINNTQVDNAKDKDEIMSMYNLIEYSHYYMKSSRISRQFCIEKLAVNTNGDINDYYEANLFNATTNSFKIKEKIQGEKGNDGAKSVKIMVPLKYLRYVRRTLEIPLISCEINIILTWPANFVTASTGKAYQGTTWE